MKLTDLIKPDGFQPSRDNHSVIGFGLNQYYDIASQDKSGFTGMSQSRFTWEETLDEVKRLFESRYCRPHQITVSTISYQGNGYARPTIKSTLVGVVTEM
jgi:hypothetical protein